MRIETHDQVRSLTIFDVPKLDPITVVMQDFGPGKGRLIVECFGVAWTSYWGAMGNRRIHEFIDDCGADYITGKLLPYGDRRILKKEEASLNCIVTAIKDALKTTIPEERKRNG